MKAKNLVLFLFLIVIGCKQDTKISMPPEGSLSDHLKYQVKNQILTINSGKFQYSFKKKQIPFKRIIVLNSSLLGFIDELDAENTLIGVSSPEYIYSQKILDLIQEGKIHNVGSEQKFDVEKIITLKPDAIFSNYVASFENTYQLLKNNGIEVIFLDEYKEQKPLAKTAYLKLFGKLLGKEEIADRRFAEISNNYKNIQKLASQSVSKPNVLANEMYGDLWYLPGGKTSLAHFISDANANYILQKNDKEVAVTMSFEEVYAKSTQINYWVNAGNHTSKQELLNINPLYKNLEVFTKGKIYGLTAKEQLKANDFFCSGVVRADLVLKDYVKIFHPDLLPNYTLTYMNELQ